LITQSSGKGYCPFSVQIDQSSGQTTTTSTGPNGETIYKITGNAVATVTNLKTGKQLTYKISDPGTVVVIHEGAVPVKSPGRGGGAVFLGVWAAVGQARVRRRGQGGAPAGEAEDERP